jgi:hypothetical protein
MIVIVSRFVASTICSLCRGDDAMSSIAADKKLMIKASFTFEFEQNFGEGTDEMIV